MGVSVIEVLVATVLGMVLATMTVPGLYKVAQSYKASGSARGLASQLAVTKLRAADKFTQARLNVNSATGSYAIEVWDKTLVAFVAEGGTQFLPAGAVFGFGSISAPPPGSQAAIGQTTQILFNSRGIPVDSTGAPTSSNALYVSDTLARYFYAVTVSASSKVTVWRRDFPTSSWVKQ